MDIVGDSVYYNMRAIFKGKKCSIDKVLLKELITRTKPFPIPGKEDSKTR